MKDTKIAWTEHTLNMWWGCTKVSPGCANCYASTMAHRWAKDIWGKGKPREDHRKNATKEAKKWNNHARGEAARWEALHRSSRYPDRTDNELVEMGFKKPERPRVFCSSMSDWLDDEVPIEWLCDLWNTIRLTPYLDWMLLSKRLENWSERIGDAATSTYLNAETWVILNAWKNGTPPANVWIGTTVEDQQRADERIPLLLSIPAKIRFLSCEPLISPVSIPDALPWALGNELGDLGIHWAICGAESGPKARHMDIEWARSLRDQCQAAGVPFFMKQMTVGKKLVHDLEDMPDDLRIREFPNAPIQP